MKESVWHTFSQNLLLIGHTILMYIERKKNTKCKRLRERKKKKKMKKVLCTMRWKYPCSNRKINKFKWESRWNRSFIYDTATWHWKGEMLILLCTMLSIWSFPYINMSAITFPPFLTQSLLLCHNIPKKKFCLFKTSMFNYAYANSTSEFRREKNVQQFILNMNVRKRQIESLYLAVIAIRAN